jgi:hypothetical protein
MSDRSTDRTNVETMRLDPPAQEVIGRRFRGVLIWSALTLLAAVALALAMVLAGLALEPRSEPTPPPRPPTELPPPAGHQSPP